MAVTRARRGHRRTAGTKTRPTAVLEGDSLYGRVLDIPHGRLCKCPPNHLNCLTAKEWLKCQVGVWQFGYERRDVRDKSVHPATFPIALARRVVELFTHRGELVLDPFVGSGTTLVAARDAGRSAAGFDLQERYVRLCAERLAREPPPAPGTWQLAVQDDARRMAGHIGPGSAALVFTSPPYANLLNRRRRNKSRRDRRNPQLGRVEQYSQDPRDLGTMGLEDYARAIGDVFEGAAPLLAPRAHCVVNVPDMWWEGSRVTIHVSVVEELRRRGYELRNIVIWDKTNLVNRKGIFGWPSNYITMGITYEYLLDFVRPDQGHPDRPSSRGASHI